MEELDEIDSLPDDLFLDDVIGDKKKYLEWEESNKGRKIGPRAARGRSKKRGGFSRGLEEMEEDLFARDEHDLNALENWDLGDDELLKGGASRNLFRSRSKRGRVMTSRRGQFKRGGTSRQVPPDEPVQHPEDIFDIESKSHHREFGWTTRDFNFVSDESPRRVSNSMERETYRKDPRLTARETPESADSRFAPRLKQPDVPGSDTDVYRKEPRLTPSQALVDPRLKQFDRFSLRKDSRLSGETPPGVEEGDSRIISPPSPDNSSSGRKRSRHARERSISPRKRSVSPRRGRDWRSGSRDRGSSPGRRSRRSPSPRGRHRHSREWSGSPRRDRRDRSLSPRGRRSSFSPPHHSPSQDNWREFPRKKMPLMPPPNHYTQVQPPQQSYEVLAPPPQQNMYTEGTYTAGTSESTTYNYPNYQQYGYDYYQQAPQPPPPPPPPASYSADYVPTAPQPPSWPEGGMVYPDISQPPPVQIPTASGSQTSSAAPVSTAQSTGDHKSEEAKKEAVKNELIQQKQTLSKQREEYVRKKTLIAHELQLLREQEEELLEENSRDNDRILKENHKLQLEIQNKLKAINNVIDMLTGIIGDKNQVEENRTGKASLKESEKKKPKTPPETPPHSSSDSDHTENTTTKPGPDEKPVYNYVHYDPEMHWCRVCNVFPRTAKEYLNHLHSTDHKEETLERKLVDMPWHKILTDQEVPLVPGAPTKRTPIRGLQFFISATAWYCKLCDVWIGDLHCASLHLKSKRHAENYSKFTEQNPHWETDWLADREKAYERRSEDRRRLKEEKEVERPISIQSSKPLTAYGGKMEVKDEKNKKKNKDQRKKLKRNCITALDETKKKKRRKKKQKSKKQHGSPHSSSSSSSSSSSASSSENGVSDVENEDKSKSIRVAMRNKMKEPPPPAPPVPVLPRSRWDSPPPEEKPEEDHEQKQKSGDDKLIREWMSTSKEVTDGEKQLLNSIKDRLRQKQEADRDRDRRDSRRSRRHSDSPGSPSYRSKRSRSDEERRERSSRFDRYDRHEVSHRSSPRREAPSSKSEPKPREELEVKVPEKRSDPEKKMEEEEEEEDEDSAESKFEKQTAESAAAKLMKKAKKPPVMSIPKSKLPFIGRMPILKHFAKKKKPEDSKEDEKKNLPEDPLVQAQYKLEFTNVGGKVHIGPHDKQKPAIGPELPENRQVQDMDIDEDTSNSDVPAPVIETEATETPKKPLTDIPLPKDFQDALNILFPGQEGSEQKEEATDGVIQSGPKPPSQQGAWPSHHHMMQGYGGPPMMGPMHGPPQGMYGPGPYGMPGPMMGPPSMQHMMHKNERQPPPPPPRESRVSPAKKEKVGGMSADELALLGIDAGDMAAQSF